MAVQIVENVYWVGAVDWEVRHSGHVVQRIPDR